MPRKEYQQTYIKNPVLADLALVNPEGADIEGANLELFQLKEAILSEKTTMMDGTKHDESWAKRIEESQEPG